MDKTITTDIPWFEVKDWVPGDWYPCPIGFMARDQEEYIVDGYMIFRQDPTAPEDMIGKDCPDGCFTFTEALSICESHNKRRMIE